MRELKVVIERQPDEIEQAWKLERDDLIKRNQNVHEENQRVEKEMGELEEELVQTKMRYAEVSPARQCWHHLEGELTGATQINSQHEALSRRWTDLKRQFV